MRRPALRHLALALLVAGALARPAQAQEESTAYNGIVGLGSALCTVIYSPLKVVYAAGGLAITGLAFLWTFGDMEVVGPLYRYSVGGDYVVTPSHLEGRQRLRFAGGP